MSTPQNREHVAEYWQDATDSYRAAPVETWFVLHGVHYNRVDQPIPTWLIRGTRDEFAWPMSDIDYAAWKSSKTAIPRVLELAL